MKLREDLTLRKIGNDYIVINPNQGMVDMTAVLKLNHTAAFIWKEFQGKEISEKAITALLLNNYNITSEIAASDAAVLLKLFKEKGTLEDK